jgi:hypothetical protein
MPWDDLVAAPFVASVVLATLRWLFFFPLGEASVLSNSKQSKSASSFFMGKTLCSHQHQVKGVLAPEAQQFYFGKIG